MSNGENKSSEHLPFFTVEGLDYDESQQTLKEKFPKKRLEININNHEPDSNTAGSEEVSGYGTYITRLAANKMVDQLWDGIYNNVININEAVDIKTASTMEQASSSEQKEAQAPASGKALSSEQAFALQQALRAAPGYVIFSKESLTFLLSQKNCAGIKFYFCRNHLGEFSLVLAGVDKNSCDLGAIPPACSIIDRDLTNPLKKQQAYQSNSVEDTTKVGTETISDLQNKNNQNTSLVTKENSAIVEVGGPNKNLRAAVIVTLWEALTDERRTDSYSKAIREFFKNKLLGEKL